ITNEFGNEIIVPNDYNGGIFTEFVGFATFEITEEDIPMNFIGAIGNNTTLNPCRLRFKFPQHATKGESFSMIENSNTDIWRKENFRFSGSTLYSVARFHGTVFNSNSSNNQDVGGGFLQHDQLNSLFNRDIFWNTGTI